ncbi:hypothetical protein [Streptomyces sp. TLI_105]|uniref:hypothetical protein n=1 Tax=Streptomyces sp. TLI_105 TaxID=1881019 RepID=UPI000B85D5B5|nr:hypothetical protein [Streptomyces sp. TLI_105]
MGSLLSLELDLRPLVVEIGVSLGAQGITGFVQESPVVGTTGCGHGSTAARATAAEPATGTQRTTSLFSTP